MSTPYITPNELNNMPTGIAWSTLPNPRATASTAEAIQLEICWRATAEVDGIVNQVLRATVDAETLEGPDIRLTVSPNGSGLFIAMFWPILSVINAEYSVAAAYPPSWTTIGANNVRVRDSIQSIYSAVPPGGGGTGQNEISIAPQFVTWLSGRRGVMVRCYYVNGWPHAGITTAANIGDNSLEVDDVTAWANFTGEIADGASTEMVKVLTATATAPITLDTGDVVQVGPGVVTLQNPLLYAHAAGVSLSGLPWDIKWATGLLAAAEALTRGAQATTVQRMPGSSVGGTPGIDNFKTAAKAILKPYMAVI